jgi:hypothetical protein
MSSSDGPKILAKGIPIDNFGVPIDNFGVPIDFLVLKYKGEIMIIKYDKNY